MSYSKSNSTNTGNVVIYGFRQSRIQALLVAVAALLAAIAGWAASPGHTETEVEFPNGDVVLKGTLIVPFRKRMWRPEWYFCMVPVL